MALGRWGQLINLAGLGRWGQLADFWPRSGRHEAGCPQRPSPYPSQGPRRAAQAGPTSPAPAR
ncbi:MAG: hypothetical protein C0441_02635 [Comamonadaceae bacterium]|nr:hypothetical protein [Comamonadaceae bacterium]